MEKKIAVIKGDGIGPEIVNETMLVLDRAAELFGHKFIYTDVLMGGIAIDETGVPLPDETIRICKESDSVLLGAVGGPKWDTLPGNLRPEAGLLKIRSELGLFANLRPSKLFPALSDACPLKIVDKKAPDLLIVRELTGGAYFGKRETIEKDGVKSAYDTMSYSDYEIERIVKVGFDMARKRNKKLCSVDKANVLDSSRLWREIAHKIKEEYPDIEYSDMFVDNCAMQLIRDPSQFDVIVTENLFGDILSDEASMISGSLGMLPSASLSSTSLGLYEPVHGSAPDIAGTGKANPIATILSSAMMLRYSFDMSKEADAIEKAVETALSEGFRTADIMSDGMKEKSCSEMGEIIRSNIRA